MSESSRQLIHRWYEEVWNKQSEEAIDEMFAPDGKCYGIPEPDSVLVGPEGFKTVHRTFLAAFPDIRLTVHDIICEGDRVAVTWVANMTHLGDSLGFAPTFQKVSLEGCSVLSLRNGQILDGKNYMEMQGLVQRLREASTAAESASV